MTDRTTTRRPTQLRVDTVITAYPAPRDTDQFGEPGRWTVTAPPEQFDAWIRVDAHDDEKHRDVVWFLPNHQDVTVELSGPELLAEAARLVAEFTASGDLPEMLKWEIAREGISCGLACATYDRARNQTQMQEVAAYFSSEVTERESAGSGFVRLTVTAQFEGVPVEVWTLVQAPKPVEQAEDGSK